ncbi:MAG: hypothetical protein HDT29_05800 [Clostridiales bacterium]|nr:hypothetical protein [Clostridiales bacterium]
MCKEKKCTNCIFFKSYNEASISSENIGFCTRYFISSEKANNHISENTGCDMWEAGENNRKAEIKHIQKMLRDIQEKLAHIVQILQEENNLEN